MKQVRFGKLASFTAEICDFGPFRATLSVKNFGPPLCAQWSARTFGSVKYFLRFCSPKANRAMGTMTCPKKPENLHGFQARGPVCRFFTEKVVRNDRTAPFLLKKTLRSAVGTPICQIVPVSHADPSPHFWPKDIFQGRRGGVYLRPLAAGILYRPPFIHLPPPGGYFQRWGGGGI